MKFVDDDDDDDNTAKSEQSAGNNIANTFKFYSASCLHFH